MNATNSPNVFDVVRAFDSLDHKAIAEYIARNNPYGFMEAVEDLGDKAYAKIPTPAWMIEVVAIARAGGSVIEAIKLLRTHTGCGLKEGIYVVRTLAGRSGYDLDANMQAIYDRFVAAGLAQIVYPPAKPVAEPEPIAHVVRRMAQAVHDYHCRLDAAPVVEAGHTVYVVLSNAAAGGGWIAGIYSNEAEAEAAVASNNRRPGNSDDTFFVSAFHVR